MHCKFQYSSSSSSHSSLCSRRTQFKSSSSSSGACHCCSNDDVTASLLAFYPQIRQLRRKVFWQRRKAAFGPLAHWSFWLPDEIIKNVAFNVYYFWVFVQAFIVFYWMKMLAWYRLFSRRVVSHSYFFLLLLAGRKQGARKKRRRREKRKGTARILFHQFLCSLQTGKETIGEKRKHEI